MVLLGIRLLMLFEMNAVLNDDSLDQWQKIKIFQGKKQQCNNFIYEIDYSDTKYTNSSEYC